MGADGLVAAAVPGVKRQPGRLPAGPVAAQRDVVGAPDLPHAAAQVFLEHVVGVALDGHGGGVAVGADPVVADQVEALLPGVQALPPAVHQLDVGDRGGLSPVQAGEVDVHHGVEQLLRGGPVLRVNGVEDGIHELDDLGVFGHGSDRRRPVSPLSNRYRDNQEL